MSSKKKQYTTFEKLPLEVQSYVQSEVEKRLNIACETLRTQNVALSKERSFPIKLVAGCWLVLSIVIGWAAWFVAPEKIYALVRELVEEKVTVPEIENAAQAVLSQKLDALAEEKMKPFGTRALELEQMLRVAETNVVKLKAQAQLSADLTMANAYDRAAYERVCHHIYRRDDQYELCQSVVTAVKNRLASEKETLNFVVMTRPGINGAYDRGRFSMEEIYDDLIWDDSMEGAVNIIRLDKHRCFHKVLLDIASNAKNLKTSAVAVSVLEKLGAPSSTVWNLASLSNWVEHACEKDKQFPDAEYKNAMRMVQLNGISNSRTVLAAVLDKFSELDRVRTLLIVDALSQRDVSAATKLYKGYGKNGERWRDVADCYFLSATNSQVRASKHLLECNKRHPSLIVILNSFSYWGLNHWFDVGEINRGLEPK